MERLFGHTVLYLYAHFGGIMLSGPSYHILFVFMFAV